MHRYQLGIGIQLRLTFCLHPLDCLRVPPSLFVEVHQSDDSVEGKEVFKGLIIVVRPLFPSCNLQLKSFSFSATQLPLQQSSHDLTVAFWPLDSTPAVDSSSPTGGRLMDCTQQWLDCPHFNRMFPSSDSWRPVLDLSTLYTFFEVPSFVMDTAEIIRVFFRPMDWVTFLDAYFHMPIHPSAQLFLCFSVFGYRFQFWALWLVFWHNDLQFF